MAVSGHPECRELADVADGNDDQRSALYVGGRLLVGWCVQTSNQVGGRLVERARAVDLRQPDTRDDLAKAIAEQLEREKMRGIRLAVIGQDAAHGFSGDEEVDLVYEIRRHGR